MHHFLTCLPNLFLLRSEAKKKRRKLCLRNHFDAWCRKNFYRDDIYFFLFWKTEKYSQQHYQANICDPIESHSKGFISSNLSYKRHELKDFFLFVYWYMYHLKNHIKNKNSWTEVTDIGKDTVDSCLTLLFIISLKAAFMFVGGVHSVEELCPNLVIFFSFFQDFPLQCVYYHYHHYQVICHSLDSLIPLYHSLLFEGSSVTA